MYGLISHRLKINGSNACIFGSMESYYELSLLALGAAHVTTIEYNNLAHIHQRITAKSKFNFDALYHSTTSRYRDSFDLEVSMSAFDHDGRGRCGRRYGEIRLSRMGGGSSGTKRDSLSL